MIMPSGQLLPIIHPSTLDQYLNRQDYIFIDCRPKMQYDEKHLTGALHMDLETLLAAVPENAANGGRHPLPEFNDFVNSMGKLGIHEKSHILLYDNHSGANYAARLWWMLKSIGHQTVQVIDGGFNGILTANLPTSFEATLIPIQATYQSAFETWQLPLISINELDKIVQSHSATIVDVRDRNRYLGINEPIDLIAGHIPGALNIPFSENLTASGYFQPVDILKKKYSHLSADSVVHCGSGVTACHTILAMAYAGLDLPKLYVGSWSEWSRNERQIAIGEEN
jgi:thiosulfate/3-mercaptopyruvate sulfurtransferase